MLDEYHLVNLFTSRVGNGVVPIRFARWACISAIAAAMAGRVWVPVNWLGGKPFKLRPNLYVLMIGEAATFKSAAILTAKDMLLECPYAETTVNETPGQPNGGLKPEARIQVYRGTLNGKSMIDLMQTTRRRPWLDQFYLVQDELAAHLGTDSSTAGLTVRALTDMYYLGAYQEATRTSGYNKLRVGYSLNVLWGTTETWMRDYIPASTVAAGFFSRVCTIHEVEQRRAPFDPPVPEDAAEIWAYMVDALSQVCLLEGEVQRDPAAYAWEREWWEKRPLPTDSSGWTYDQRQRDWLEKLAMVHMAGGRRDMRLTIEDYQTAAEWVVEASENPMPLLRTTQDTGELADVLRKKIQNSPRGVARGELAVWCNQHRMPIESISPYLKTWVEAGNLEVETIATAGRPRIVYHWREKDDNLVGES